LTISTESLVAVAIGIGLAAASGLRVFLPLLVAGIAARFGALPLSDGFQWLSSNGAIIALATAAILEVGAYSIPGLDHLLDVIASPAVLAAGAVTSAAVMVNIPPAIMWPVAIIGGGGVAALTKTTSALVRAKSGLATAGLANPVVATSETVGALGVSVIAIAVPLICLAGIVVMMVWVVRKARRVKVRW
jgi:hypothetical protein